MVMQQHPSQGRGGPLYMPYPANAVMAVPLVFHAGQPPLPKRSLEPEEVEAQPSKVKKARGKGKVDSNGNGVYAANSSMNFVDACASHTEELLWKEAQRQSSVRER